MKDKILSHLGAGHIWAGSIRYYPTIDSTNTEGKRLAEANAPHGMVLIADHQTQGRGRTGNTFHSPKNDGIYLSVILRPNCTPLELSHLTCAVGCAVCNAIEDVTTVRPQLKWINDIVADGKKLGGILTELSLSSEGKVTYAVIGIGINCNQSSFPQEIAGIATSLSLILNRSVHRAELIAAIIDKIYHMQLHLFTDIQQIMTQYRKDCITIGKEILIQKGDESIQATALDVLDDGILVVRYKDGQIGHVNSGMVHVRGLFGYC